ncbi:MAG: type II toxin-antitoxin system PemK/MazF family toxin [Deltaproteobacteria bacterium]|nr:type II toxin-antitoxin system PemK/MazF family toxin [Deltaproteobacteria bacterium]
MGRGAVWWAELPDPVASEPGFRRPVVIIQSNAFNRSRIRTVVVVLLTSNLRLADAPGNVLITAADSSLPKDSVANVSQVITVDKGFLSKRSGRLPSRVMKALDDGLRLVLSL